jgi:ribosomal protein S27AE
VISQEKVEVVASEYVAVPSKKPEFIPKAHYCNKCGDGIFSAFEGQFVTCSCGAISVDQTQYYTRFIGNPEDFKRE